jgi:hypothetical protein
VFIIEDERHVEPHDVQLSSRAEAVAELRRRATLPRDEPPNAAPCANRRGCGRTYAVVEYDTPLTPWREVSRVPYRAATAAGARWLRGADSGGREPAEACP